MWQLTDREETWLFGSYFAVLVALFIGLVCLDAGSGALGWTLGGWTVAWAIGGSAWQSVRFRRRWRQCRR